MDALPHQPASNARVEPAVERFLEEMRVPGILATIGRSGGPVTSAVWFAYAAGTIIVSTPADGTKANNVRANERVSFIVDSRERPYAGVAIEGSAAVVEDPGGRLWRAIATRYLGETLPPDVIQRFEQRTRVILHITPARIRSWNLGAS